ncbi:class I SAM-dependent methyltransferase [Jeotgalibacillus proteolyticus]|uniref:SAM-dependent methyltransferase n=1 Tax=Jeotgalibacillus proteolyticus TaxID=2082395 RepID=A0A2S5G8S6_9BACL|nr:rRNA adenine N-6-methyltransferase family protein [Jeotgalibacillus proteolyticus]PPA69407.1 SAM-dependent methyltransferase [Jeotgalibacillus proteolyticus]
MQSIKFLQQYFFAPRKIGAILPSSGYLAKTMVETIDFSSANYIVELGAGTGVFTDKILQYRESDTLVILFENNTMFYEMLNEKYKSESNFIIINDTAESIDKYIKKYKIPSIDYVISGLPFASLPENVSSVILDKTRSLLKNDGTFITFQYTLLKKEMFNQYFEQIDIKREYRNAPPAFVLSCQSKNGNTKRKIKGWKKD